MNKIMYLYGDNGKGSDFPYNDNNINSLIDHLIIGKININSLYLCKNITSGFGPWFNIGCDKFDKISSPEHLTTILQDNSGTIYVATMDYIQKYHKKAYNESISKDIELGALSTQSSESTIVDSDLITIIKIIDTIYNRKEQIINIQDNE